MRIFLTGATGFVGSAIVADMVSAGHQILGLARSDRSAESLIAAGAEAHRGDLKDLESLRRGAAMADGVIHAAFDHDFSNFAQNCEADQRAIQAMGETLAGSDRPIIVTAGLPLISGRPATEGDASDSAGSPRTSEQTAISLIAQGVRASVVRMSQVHDRHKHGLATYLIALARKTGISAYVGDGSNRWPAVHRLDTAPLYRLAFQKKSADAIYHAVAEEGVQVRAIAQAIGRGLNLPIVSLSSEEATAHFGWLAFPVGMDALASSGLTQERLGWRPTQEPGFLADLERSSAFDS